MSVGTQLADAIRKLSEDRFEDAIVSASVALSATARLEYPACGDKEACRNFLQQNLPIISKIGWVAFGVSQPINFLYRRLDSKKPGKSIRTMPEMLYDVIRCTAVHEAKLPDNLRFTKQPLVQTGSDGELVLPIDLVYGLLLAVVASPKNADQRFEGNPGVMHLTQRPHDVELARQASAIPEITPAMIEAGIAVLRDYEHLFSLGPTSEETLV
jgi:hypothetical protein